MMRYIPDPNALYGKQSIWMMFLDECIPDLVGSGSEKLRRFLESGVLYTLLQHGADFKVLVDMKMQHTWSEVFIKIPAWLGIIFTMQATSTPVHKEMYEQVLKHLLQDLRIVEEVRLRVENGSGGYSLQWHNFWDCCKSHLLRGPHESVIISTFSESLQRLRSQSKMADGSYHKACQWVRSGLSDNGQKQFDSAIAALEVQPSPKTSLKRKSRPQVSRKRQRKVARKS